MGYYNNYTSKPVTTSVRNKYLHKKTLAKILMLLHAKRAGLDNGIALTETIKVIMTEVMRGAFMPSSFFFVTFFHQLSAASH